MYKKIIETTIRTLYHKIKDEEVEKLKKEIVNLKTEVAALKENKIYTKTIDSYEKVENKTIYFSQEELEKYLKCMYTNIFQTGYSIGHNKIIEKTGLDKGVARAIKVKLVEDSIVKVEKYRTKVIKYLPNHEEVTEEKTMSIDEYKLHSEKKEAKTIEELRMDREKRKLNKTKTFEEIQNEYLEKEKTKTTDIENKKKKIIENGMNKVSMTGKKNIHILAKQLQKGSFKKKLWIFRNEDNKDEFDFSISRGIPNFSNYKKIGTIGGSDCKVKRKESDIVTHIYILLNEIED